MSERRPLPSNVADRLAATEQLDGVAEPLAKQVRNLLPAGPVKDALSGTWLGHAVHPLLQLLPLGTWTSAVVLDLIGGEDGESSADKLLALAGMGVVGVGGWLGGHLSYAEGVGVDNTAFEDYPSDWTAVADDADVLEGVARRVEVDGIPL